MTTDDYNAITPEVPGMAQGIAIRLSHQMRAAPTHSWWVGHICKKFGLIQVGGSAERAPRFDHGSTGFGIQVGSTWLRVPEKSWHTLQAFVAEIQRTHERGDNRGVPTDGSHTDPDTAAGKPDVVIDGAPQPISPDREAQPGLQQAGGRLAPPVQQAIRADRPTIAGSAA
ncbi:MAG: hypothetical protein LBL59_07350 [Xanthomonadaceae bacterium]|jgi:hypothetical protein|nr:hypothetical protein [Xanthomonadaceae bacterium]